MKQIWKRCGGHAREIGARDCLPPDSEGNDYETGLDHRAVEYGNPRRNLPPCRGIPKVPRRKPRFAQGGRNNIEKGNIKWLAPFQQAPD